MWRPSVASGWRPYYYGSWARSPRGTLVWVSSEPWGFVPYHYGRWAFTPLYGWVWLPGGAYAPAWVYWAFGPSYVGWAPMGFYDCYNPYYDWAYRPYRDAGFGFGFYGQIRLSRTDLTPWTFVGTNGLTTGRIDRAALTTDAIRDRLNRDGDRATVTNNPLQFTRDELRNPASAIVNRSRRGIGGGTGKDGSGSTTDLTPFFRRDPELSTDLRQRVIRRDPSSGTGELDGNGNGRINRSGGTPSSGVVDRGRATRARLPEGLWSVRFRRIRTTAASSGSVREPRTTERSTAAHQERTHRRLRATARQRVTPSSPVTSRGTRIVKRPPLPGPPPPTLPPRLDRLGATGVPVAITPRLRLLRPSAIAMRAGAGRWSPDLRPLRPHRLRLLRAATAIGAPSREESSMASAA